MTDWEAKEVERFHNKRLPSKKKELERLVVEADITLQEIDAMIRKVEEEYAGCK